MLVQLISSSHAPFNLSALVLLLSRHLHFQPLIYRISFGSSHWLNYASNYFSIVMLLAYVLYHIRDIHYEKELTIIELTNSAFVKMVKVLIIRPQVKAFATCFCLYL